MRVHLEQECLFEPQGGFSEDRLKFIQDITSFGAANGTVLSTFEFSTTQTFMIAAIGFNTQTTIRFVFIKTNKLLII